MSLATYLLVIVAAIISTVGGVLAFAGVASDRVQGDLGGGVSEGTDDGPENPEA